MWHEARKNERIVRKAIVNYRKRAERKHDYYDKIKQDPIKFMQVHGRRCKLHINENEIEATNSMVAWQGDKSNMIDRFDVRAHLDIIRENAHANLDISMDKEERKLNFERFRNLVYNKYKGTSEQSHLQQIRINESFPEAGTQRQDAEAKKKMLAPSKASISFNYDRNQRGGANPEEREEGSEEEDEHDILSDEEFWRELEEIPPLQDCLSSSLKEMEVASLEYGMCYGDFAKSLANDQSLQNKMDRQKEIESQKQKMAGKKSRRERRILKDNRLKGRVIGPLSYIYRNDDEEEQESTSSESDSNSSSGSRSSSEEEKGDSIEFITSFGENNTNTNTLDIGSKSKKTKKKPKSKSPEPKSYSSRHDSRRRSRSRSTDRKYHRARRHSDSRSPESDRYPWKTRSRKSSRRTRSRTRSRSPERKYPWQRSRSRSRSPRRRQSSSKSSHLRRSSSKEKSPVRSRPVANLKLTPVSKTAIDVKNLTPQEKLKIKMQRALKKQLKADKIATADKRAQAYQEQLERDEDLRMMVRRNRRGDYRDSPPRRSLHEDYR